MGGIFGVASKCSCTLDLFFGTDYHSHLGTRSEVDGLEFIFTLSKE